MCSSPQIGHALPKQTWSVVMRACNIPKVAGTNFFKIKKSQNLIGAPRGM